jgi:hypothetical protein
VFRAVLFSIVLLLATGQNVSMVCQTWCPDATAASGCHRRHATDSLTLSCDGSCDDRAPIDAAVLKEDARRSVSAPNADHALAVPRYHLTPATAGTRPDCEVCRLQSLEKRPLETVLRI